MKNDEVTSGWEGEPWVCVCVRNGQKQRWKWLSTDVVVVMVLLLFLTCSCLQRGAGVSRSLLLSVLSLVMVVLMMLLMFFMSAKMWAMRCWRVWGAVPAECYSDHHQSSQRVICWIIQLMKLQKYYSITISLWKSLRCYFTCCQCCWCVCTGSSPVLVLSLFIVVFFAVVVFYIAPTDVVVIVLFLLLLLVPLLFELRPVLREILEEW